MRYSITCKLSNMRKTAEWTVYPRPTNVSDDYNLIQIQSDTRICLFDKTTGKGIISKAISSGAYQIHLQPNFGSMPIQVPQDVIDAAIAAQPHKGDHLGQGVYIG